MTSQYPQPPAPPPLPPFAAQRPAFERAPLGSGPRRGPPPPGSPRKPPPRRRSGLLVGVVYFLLVVLFVGGAGVGYLVLNPPSDFIRQKITEQVKARTGRDLVIAGPATFAFFPELGVSLHDVSLSAPAGMDGTLLHAEALQVSVEPISLLQQRPKINAVTLRQPVFDFHVDKNGRNNWKFATNRAATQVAELQRAGTLRDASAFDVAAAEVDGNSVAIPSVSNVQLDNVRIEDGTIRFSDDRTGRKSQVSGINVKLGLPSLESPLVANGNLVWRDQRLDFDGKIENVRGLLMNAPAHLTFSTKNGLINASYSGDLTVQDGAILDGQVSAKADSARQLAEWFGSRLPPVTGFGPLSIEGKLQTADNVTEFSNATFALDGETAKGTIKVTTGGVRPFVEANLAISALDLNKYLTNAVVGTLVTESANAPADPAPAAAPAAGPDEIQKLLQKQGTKVYGVEQRAGWSSERLNLTLLGLADGKAQLAIGRLHFKNVSIGQSSVDVTVNNRAMQASFNDVALYEGHGRGVLTLDGSADTANIGANFNFDSVSALPFLKDAANFGWVSGNANVKLQLAANGASQLQLIESLNGNAGFQFSNGAIVGFNLPGALRGLSQGNFGALRTSPTEKTDFSALAATFTVTNGVAQNQDLQLVSPLLRATGSGVIHMPQRTVDYTVKPKLIASLEGQGGNAQASGIEVPVRITGSWDHPSYHPDLNGVLADPNKTMDAIKNIGKKLKGKNSDEIVDSLFGKKGDEDPQTEKTKKKAKKLLNQLFGKADDQN
ncbi:MULTISPECIES: AsmA family protein [unclassified Hyphomicrobium]|uniref:AsmA family protein n=1 Tax=unclassified Hyphomicrobium TaxID=2619925 RepID=UPI000213EDC8|nr:MULTISPECIES: AsmA family protein [unclassified Hyphomicrobium]CCB67256.1 AsmA family protein [Hyphomicrobium sp. MC1]